MASWEAAHAVLGWFLEHVDPMLKLGLSGLPSPVPVASGRVGTVHSQWQPFYFPRDVMIWNWVQKVVQGCVAEKGGVPSRWDLDASHLTPQRLDVKLASLLSFGPNGMAPPELPWD